MVTKCRICVLISATAIMTGCRRIIMRVKMYNTCICEYAYEVYISGGGLRVNISRVSGTFRSDCPHARWHASLSPVLFDHFFFNFFFVFHLLSFYLTVSASFYHSFYSPFISFIGGKSKCAGIIGSQWRESRNRGGMTPKRGRTHSIPHLIFHLNIYANSSIVLHLGQNESQYISCDIIAQ